MHDKRSRAEGLLGIVSLATVALPACTNEVVVLGSGDSPTSCAPGLPRLCFGAGQCAGSQVCNADGTAWSGCDCGAGASGNTGGHGATGSAGGTGASGNWGGDGGSTAAGGSGGFGGQAMACEWNDRFDTFDAGSYYVDTDCGGWQVAGREYALVRADPQYCRSRIFYAGRTFHPDGLSVHFTVRIQRAVDGFALAIVVDPTFPRVGNECAVPNCGGHLDLEGASGFGVEFDRHSNPEWDPSADDHVALVQDGASQHVAWTPYSLADGEPHSVRVDVGADRLGVEVDGEPALDVPSFSAPTDTSYYVGFTSGTAGGPDDIFIDDFCIEVD